MSHLQFFRRYLTANQALQGNRSLVGIPAWQDDDDFGPIRQEEDSGNATDGDNGELSYIALSMSIVVQAIINPSYYRSSMQLATRDTDLYNILIESEDASTYILSSAIFEAIEDQRLVLTRKAISSLVELGTDLTRIYAYKKLTATRDFIYNLLSSTLYTWIHAEESVASAVEELLPLWQWCVDNLVQGRLDSWRNRHRVVMLLDTFIFGDPTETRWFADSLLERDRETPSGAMLKTLEDSDIRIRFRLATSVAQLLQLDMPISSKPSSFYLKVARHFRFQGSDKEYILSRAILMTNVIIVSSGARRAPFFHLYDTVAGHPSLQTHIESAFQAVTILLRLRTFSVLYLEYATRLLAAQGKEDQDPLHIPVALYGFQSRATWALKTVEIAGASLLLSPECEGFWESLIEVAQLDKIATLGHHLATAIAMAAAMKAMSDTDGKAFRTELSRLKAKYSLVDSRKNTSWTFTPAQTANMAATLFQLVDESISVTAIHELLKQIDLSKGTRHSLVYKALLFRPTHGSPVDLEETITPKSSGEEVLRAMQLLAQQFELSPNLIVVNTLMQLMSKISESCLVNERRRMVYSLALLIAYYPESSLEPEIFDLLLRSFACLFKQPDLAGLMVNFLSWALDQLRQGGTTCKTPVPILSGLANSASAYIVKGNDLAVAGRNALSSMETFMVSMFAEELEQDDHLKQRLMREIARLLALWPRTLPNELEKKVACQTYGQIRDQASYTDISVGKFSLSKHLARHAYQDRYAPTYRRNTFWQLRSSITHASSISSEDMQAFTLLLYNSEGLVEIPDHETIEGLTGSTGIPPASLQSSTRKADQTATSRRRVISLLLEDLRGTELQRVSLAFKALAGISSSAPMVYRSADLDAISQGQLGLLVSTAPMPKAPNVAVEDLEEALLGRGYWKSAHAIPDDWIVNLTRLLIREVAQNDDFSSFLYLADIVPVSQRLSTQLVSPLLHLVLNAERQSREHVARNRQAISQYFDWLLRQENLSIECSLVIVQSILYLRNFSAAQHNSTDEPPWLQLDLRAVARVALQCRLPETALLFWEIHRDGKSDNSDLSEDELSVRVTGIPIDAWLTLESSYSFCMRFMTA
jgi:hypothetical protein